MVCRIYTRNPSALGKQQIFFNNKLFDFTLSLKKIISHLPVLMFLNFSDLRWKIYRLTYKSI